MTGRPTLPSASRKLLRGARLLFFPVAVGFLAYFVWEARESLTRIAARANPGYLLVAVLLWAALHVLSSAFLRLGLGYCGAPFTLAQAMRVHIANLPARYIPGGVWHTVGRVAMLRSAGVSAKVLALYLLMENALAPAASLLLGGGVLWLYRRGSLFGTLGGLAACAAAAGIVVVPLLARRLRDREMPAGKLSSYWATLGVLFVFWLLAATTFVVYLGGFPSLAAPSPPVELGAIYLVSWAVGFLAIFAPQGIGVFEWVIAQALGGGPQSGSLIAIAAGFRLVTLAGDTLAWLVWVGWRAARRRSGDTR